MSVPPMESKQRAAGSIISRLVGSFCQCSHAGLTRENLCDRGHTGPCWGQGQGHTQSFTDTPTRADLFAPILPRPTVLTCPWLSSFRTPSTLSSSRSTLGPGDELLRCQYPRRFDDHIVSSSGQWDYVLRM